MRLTGPLIRVLNYRIDLDHKRQILELLQKIHNLQSELNI